MKRKTILLSFLSIVLLLGVVGLAIVPETSAQYTPAEAYVVQPGDTLSKIARKYCTTWNEIYELNKVVIGSDPSVLEPGTILYVINRCGENPSDVYDRGPRLHANGTVQGNVYTVAAGDTFYSIGERFGVPWEEIVEANGLGETPKLYPGQKLIIPGLGQTTPPVQSAISITSPSAGASVYSSVIVSGTGQGLVEGNVMVQMRDQYGGIIAQQPTVLQGNDAGTGGAGVWSVTFNNIVSQPYTSGTIEALSPETGAFDSIQVWYQ